MKVQLRLGCVFGEESRNIGPKDYRDFLAASYPNLRLRGVDTHVHIRTHPRFMDSWVDNLVSTVFHIMFMELMFSFTLVMGFINHLSFLENC